MITTAPQIPAESGTTASQRPARPAKPATGPTRERLLAAAREAFSRGGFAATRVADIVALAGTSHGTFYTYFDDKRDALLVLAQDAANAIYGAAVAPLAREPDDLVGDTIGARLALFLRTYSEWWDVVRTWDHASAIHPEVDEMRARIRGSIVEQFSNTLARERAQGRLDAGPDLELTAVALTAMVEEFGNRWLALGHTVSAGEINQLTSLCAGALGGRDATGAGAPSDSD